MMAPQWFHWILRVLPFDFRSDYGREIEQVYQEQRREAPNTTARMRVSVETAASILSIGPREHLIQLRQDIAYALRGMRRQPSFVAVVIFTLALGIGANTAIFGIMKAVLLEPLPYADADRLAVVWNRWEGRAAAPLSDAEYLDYSERSKTLSIAAAWTMAASVSGGVGDPERVDAVHVTPNALGVLGVEPVLGRAFRAGEGDVGQGKVALISHDFWRNRFESSPSVIGKAVSIDGLPHEIIGVMPEGFLWPTEFGAASKVRVALPLQLDRASPRNVRGARRLFGMARIKPGTTLEAAEAEMNIVSSVLTQEYPDQYRLANFRIDLQPLRDELLGDARNVVLFLAAAVGLVLLIASANVANLLLARGEARRRELAIRSALGASRWRVTRQLLTESCVLSLAGAGAGLVVAIWIQRLIMNIDPGALPRLDQARVSLPVIAFAGALGCATGLLFGVVPAFQMSKGANADLKSGARAGTDKARVAARHLLVVTQMSIAVLLLIAGGLLARSFLRVTSVPTGINPQGVLTLQVSLISSRYPGAAEVNSFFDRSLDRVRALPGVRAAGAGSGLPLSIGSGDWGFDIEGRARVNGRRPGAADWFVVTPGYLEALGFQLVSGRMPTVSDTEQAAPIVLVNEAVARTLFKGDDPIGRRIRFGGATADQQPWRTIAGVLRDVRTRGLDQPVRPEVYFPHRQFLHFAQGVQIRAMTFVVKTQGEPSSLVSPIRAELRGLDPSVTMADARDMEGVVAASVADRRLHLMLVGAFGLLALALATIGTYGTMAFHVLQRTQEIGVRLALGAAPRDVLNLVIVQGMRLVLMGLAIGTLLALVLTPPMALLLFDVSPRDIAVYSIAPALLFAIGLVACYIPALRATRVDPLTALRSE
jgi:putative ABC transport system permease protein